MRYYFYKHDRRNYCFQEPRHRFCHTCKTAPLVNIIVPVNGIPTLNINQIISSETYPSPQITCKIKTKKHPSFHFVSKHCPSCKPCLLEKIAYQKIMYLPVGVSVIYFPIDAWGEFTLCNFC